MTTLNIVQVSLQLFCSLVLAFPMLTLCFGKKEKTGIQTELLYLFQVVMMLLIVDSIAYIFRADITIIGRLMVRASNLLVFILEYTLLICFARYLTAVIEDYGGTVRRLFIRMIFLLSLIGILMVILSQFTGLYYSINDENLYVRSDGIVINYILHFLGMIAELIVMLRHRKEIGKRNTCVIGLFFGLIVFSVALQFFWYGLSLINIGLTISVMCMYVNYSLERTYRIISQLEQLAKQREITEEMRRKIILSTIHPHFLFNSLNAIEGLITEEPDRAIEAVEDLSGFLRASIDTLHTDSMITIEQELKNVEYYLSLMKIRYGDRLEIEIDQPGHGCDYMIPPFTVQPLVENAIKHGINKNKYGKGKLIISISEEKDAHLIRVIDNGPGFSQIEDTIDVKRGEDDQYIGEGKQTHMGLTIVRERLAGMCKGELFISSVPGSGTTCEIRIHREA